MAVNQLTAKEIGVFQDIRKQYGDDEAYRALGEVYPDLAQDFAEMSGKYGLSDSLNGFLSMQKESLPKPKPQTLPKAKGYGAYKEPTAQQLFDTQGTNKGTDYYQKGVNIASNKLGQVLGKEKSMLNPNELLDAWQGKDNSLISRVAQKGGIPTIDSIRKWGEKEGRQSEAEAMINDLNTRTKGKLFAVAPTSRWRGETPMTESKGKVFAKQMVREVAPDRLLENLLMNGIMANLGRRFVVKGLPMAEKAFLGRTPTGEALTRELLTGDIQSAGFKKKLNQLIPKVKGKLISEFTGMPNANQMRKEVNSMTNEDLSKALMDQISELKSQIPTKQGKPLQEAKLPKKLYQFQQRLSKQYQQEIADNEFIANVENARKQRLNEDIVAIRAKYAKSPQQQQRVINGYMQDEQQLLDQYDQYYQGLKNRQAMGEDVTDMYEQAYQAMAEGKPIPQRPAPKPIEKPVEQPIPEQTAQEAMPEQPQDIVGSEQIPQEQGESLQDKIGIMNELGIGIANDIENGKITNLSKEDMDDIYAVADGLSEEFVMKHIEGRTSLANLMENTPEKLEKYVDDKIARLNKIKESATQQEQVVPEQPLPEQAIEQPPVEEVGATQGKEAWEMRRSDYLGEKPANMQKLADQSNEKQKAINKRYAELEMEALRQLGYDIKSRYEKGSKGALNPEFMKALSDPRFQPIFDELEKTDQQYLNAKNEYIKLSEWQQQFYDANDAWNKRFDEHKGMVEKALSEGKPVPPEVLADYPDLKAKATREELKGGKQVGGIFKEGDKVYKPVVSVQGNTTKEAEIYSELSEIDGVAQGKVVDKDGKQYIELPYYRYIYSVDDIPQNMREKSSPAIAKNIERINKTIGEISNKGINYNDWLQFGNREGKMDLFDFSSANHDQYALEDNYSQLAKFYNEFGLPRVSKAVSEGMRYKYMLDSNSAEAIRTGKVDGLDILVPEQDLEVLRQIVWAKDIEPNNVYYATNARPINLPVGQTEWIDGIKYVYSDTPLTKEQISGWELTPIYEGGKGKPKATEIPEPTQQGEKPNAMAEELRDLANEIKAKNTTKAQFLQYVDNQLNEQNLTRRDTAKAFVVDMEKAGMTPEQFYDHATGTHEPLSKEDFLKRFEQTTKRNAQIKESANTFIPRVNTTGEWYARYKSPGQMIYFKTRQAAQNYIDKTIAKEFEKHNEMIANNHEYALAYDKYVESYNATSEAGTPKEQALDFGVKEEPVAEEGGLFEQPQQSEYNGDEFTRMSRDEKVANAKSAQVKPEPQGGLAINVIRKPKVAKGVADDVLDNHKSEAELINQMVRPEKQTVADIQGRATGSFRAFRKTIQALTGEPLLDLKIDAKLYGQEIFNRVRNWFRTDIIGAPQKVVRMAQEDLDIVYHDLNPDEIKTFWDLIASKTMLSQYEKFYTKAIREGMTPAGAIKTAKEKIPQGVDVDSMQRLYDDLYTTLSSTPEGQRILDAKDRYQRYMKEILAEEIKRGNIKEVDWNGFYFPRQLLKYYDPDAYTYLPRRAQKQWRKHMMQQMGGSEDVVINEEVIRQYFLEHHMSNVIDDFAKKSREYSDIFYGTNGLRAMYNDDELKMIMGGTAPEPYRAYVINGRRYIGSQYQKGNTMFTDTVVSADKLHAKINDFLDEVGDDPEAWQIVEFLDSLTTDEPGETIKRMAMMIGKRHKTYLIPEPISKVLNNLEDLATASNPMMRYLKAYTQYWKIMTLNLSGGLKYHVGNIFGDWTNTLALGDVRTAKHAPVIGKIRSWYRRMAGQETPSVGNIRRGLEKQPIKLSEQERVITDILERQNVLAASGLTESTRLFQSRGITRGYKQAEMMLNKVNFMREANARIALAAMKVEEFLATGGRIENGRLVGNGKISSVTFGEDIKGLAPEEAIGYLARNVAVDYLWASNLFRDTLNGFWTPFITWSHKNAVNYTRNLVNSAKQGFGVRAKGGIAEKAQATLPIVAMIPGAMALYSNTKTSKDREYAWRNAGDFKNNPYMWVIATKSELGQDSNHPNRAVIWTPTVPSWMAMQYLGLDKVLTYINAVQEKRMSVKEAVGKIATDIPTGPLRFGYKLLNPIMKFLNDTINNKDSFTGQKIYPENAPPEIKADYILGKFMKTMITPMGTQIYQQYGSESFRASEWAKDSFRDAQRIGGAISAKLSGKESPMSWDEIKAAAMRDAGPFGVMRALGFREIDLQKTNTNELERYMEKQKGIRAYHIDDLANAFVRDLVDKAIDKNSNPTAFQEAVMGKIQSGELKPEQMTLNGETITESPEAFMEQLAAEFDRKIKSDNTIRGFMRQYTKALSPELKADAENAYQTFRKNAFLKKVKNMPEGRQIDILDMMLRDLDYDELDTNE